MTWQCPKCGELIPDFKDSCSFCNTQKPKSAENYCINPQCKSYKVSLNDQRKVCHDCGELTYVGKMIKDLS